MFLVLIVHADFLSIGRPTTEWVQTHPLSSMLRYVVESLALVCVNVYIIISGYFGIKVRKKSVLAFLFMVVFWRVSVLFGYQLYAYFCHVDTHSLSLTGTLKMCIPGQNDWFVSAYILLMFISPILNDYISNRDSRQLWTYVALYVGFQVIFNWLLPVYTQFRFGYSVLSFIGLYITGAAVRKSSEEGKTLVNRPLLWYFVISICAGVVAFLIARYCNFEHLKTKLLSMFDPYNGPCVYLASVMLFLAFNRLRIQNKFINFLASSAFAVYLFHMNPLVQGHYVDVCRYLYYHYGLISYIVLIGVFIVTVFTVSVLIDLIRRWLWNIIANKTRII